MSPRLRAALAVIPAAAAALLLAARLPAADTVLAIRGGRVVTVSGPVIENGTVLVRDGRVADVGPGVAIPPGATVIEAAGKVVYPGFIDALTVLGLTEIGSVPGSVDVAEVGDVNPHAKAWVALHPQSELLPVARANGVTAALAAPEGGLVSGQSALVRMTGDTPSRMALRAPAALHVVYPTGRAPFDIARLFAEPEMKTLEERLRERKKNQEKDLRRLERLLEEAKADAAAREAAAKGRAAAPKSDLPEEALAPAARGELPVVIRADAEDEIRGAVAFAKAHGLKAVIAGGLEAWRCTDVLKDVPVLLKVDRLPRRESDPYDAAYANAAALHRAGVRFAIVTDDAALSRNLPYEAAMAYAFGLPAEAAIRAITLSPAEIFGVAETLGAIAPGRAATLVVASGDILDHRTAVEHVFIDGVEQSLETKHTRLWKEFRDRR